MERPAAGDGRPQVSSTLHVPKVAILLNGGIRLQPAYALGYVGLPELPAPGPPLTHESERALRDALAAELVLPLSSNQKPVGVMGLGAKRSEEPFTRRDLQLLDSVAT